MKIQNRNSVLSTGVWKISDMSQVPETQETAKVAQTESIIRVPTEAQRTQQLGQFKSQEELLRANLQQKLSSGLNGQRIDKQRDGERFQPNTLEEYDIEIEAYERLRRDVVRTGRVGNTTRDDIPRIDERIDELIAERKALKTLLDTSGIEIRYGNGQRDVHQGSSGTGRGPDGRTPQNDTPHRSQQAPSATPSPANVERDRSRRPVSHRNSNHRNSGAAPRNQKSETGTKNLHYIPSTNSSNDSHETNVDHRNYSSNQSETARTDTPPEPKKDIKKGDKKLDEDPMTGHGGAGGNDIGGSGRIPKGSPDNRSGIQQIVQPGINLFPTTTGADDKERPNTGSSVVSNSTTGNDLGDDLPYHLSGNGGSVEIEAGKVLLEQIRPINPGGPDPTK